MAVPILRLNIDDNPRIIVKQDNPTIIVTGYTNTWGSITGTLSGQTDLWNELTGMTADIQSAQACCTGLTEIFNTYTADTFNTLSGLTWAGIVLQAQVNGLENAFESHTGDTTIHFPFSNVTDAIASATSGITATSAWSGLTGYPTDNADLNAILTGMTADILANTQCCTGNTADIDYHYSQFTAFTDYFATLIIPAITGNTQDISDLSGAFQNHTGNTLIHFEKTDISYNDLQDLPTLFSGDYDDLTNKPDLSIYLTGYTVTADDVTGITASLYAPIIHTHPYSGLTGLPTLFSGDYDDLTNKPDLSVYQPVSGMSAYLTGVTWNDVTNKPDLTLQSDFTGHTSDLTIHYPMSGISITESQISDLQAYTLTGTTQALSDAFDSHTGDTSIHYPMSGISITESQISDLKTYLTGVTFNDITGDVSGNTNLQNALDLKLDNSVYQGDMLIIAGEIDDLITGVTANTASINALDLAFNSHTGDTTIHFAQSAITITESQISDLGDYALELDLTGHTSDLTIHYPQSGISITESQISDLKAYTLTGTTQALSDAFDSHTGDTTIHFVQSAITITESQISNLQDYALDSDLTGHTSDLSIHYAQSGITISESQVTNLVSNLAGKSSTGHTHLLSAITDVTASAAELNVLDGIPAGLTATEIGYVNGVTSAIQTQIDSKVAKAGDTMTGNLLIQASGAQVRLLGTTGATKGYSWESRIGSTNYPRWALYSDGSNDATWYLRANNDAGGLLYYPIVVTRNTGIVAFSKGISLSGTTITATGTQINYLNTTTSNIQTQINNRVLKAGDTMTGNLNISNNADLYVTGQTSFIQTCQHVSDTKLGVEAFDANFTGATHNNTAIGYRALTANVTGRDNTAIGYATLFVATKNSYNVAIGGLSLSKLSAAANGANVAIGYGSMENATSSYESVSVGQYAIRNASTGVRNVGIGHSAIYNIGALGYNVGVGYQALNNTSTGSGFNTAIGALSGSYYGAAGTNAMTGTSYGVYIGNTARGSAVAGSTNEIVIGYDALGNGSNTVTLGNDNITDTYLKGAVIAPAVKIISCTGTTTIDATYAGRVVECSGTFTVTFPNSMATGMKVDIVNVGTGTITLAASTTLQSKNSKTKLETQYGGASVYHRGSNVWLAVGDLT